MMSNEITNVLTVNQLRKKLKKYPGHYRVLIFDWGKNLQAGGEGPEGVQDCPIPEEETFIYEEDGREEKCVSFAIGNDDYTGDGKVSEAMIIKVEDQMSGCDGK